MGRLAKQLQAVRNECVMKTLPFKLQQSTCCNYRYNGSSDVIVS